ncbi:hypothetical protein BDF20DRAFT_839581 [Mycotypha africana]|uniref:uncharacterized protein n=1 Tax=Mycotypha africana TaxID=64632 RepID=UPI0022FFD53F|nr:uncharacterized protein BDF20DRAFT_839581 [Mycotypha africana]KAI8968477.1 hypothetical protein BDF20DRAFT_839581 [Mycotypha africana]
MVSWTSTPSMDSNDIHFVRLSDGIISVQPLIEVSLRDTVDMPIEILIDIRKQQWALYWHRSKKQLNIEKSKTKLRRCTSTHQREKSETVDNMEWGIFDNGYETLPFRISCGIAAILHTQTLLEDNTVAAIASDGSIRNIVNLPCLLVKSRNGYLRTAALPH